MGAEVPRPTLVVAMAILCTACGQAPAPTRKIVPHKLPGCEIAEGRSLVFTALGDYPSNHAAGVEAKSSEDGLPLPSDLIGVEALSSPAGYQGIGYGETPSDIHLTIWSSTQACDALPRDDGNPLVPPSNGGEAVTAFADGGAILVAGLEPPFNTTVANSAFALAWSTRTALRLAPIGMGTHRRAWATATPFGDGALVAGGADTKYLPFKPADSALVFRGGAFQEPPISIGDARSRHGAIELSSGATLLVGGEGDDGKALASFVSIAPAPGPELGTASIFGLGSLSLRRKSPTVLRLANRRILVAGGLSDEGKPVPGLEWFEEDGSACKDAPCFVDPSWPDASDRAFVALSGGGVLAAGGIDPTTGLRARDVWWISPSGNVISLPALSSSQRGSAKVIRLVGGADGAPWLWNGDAWLRFDPWRAAFFVPADAPDDGPDDDMPAPVEVDPGLFMWLGRLISGDPTSPAALRGFRHGVRGPFARDAVALLFVDTEHVAPDRPPSPEALDFDGQWLRLATPNGEAHPPRVVVTDALYGDFDLSMEAAGDVLPELEVGAVAVGTDTCPWPSPTGSKLGLHRTGETLVLDLDGRAVPPCRGPTGRVGIALRAPAQGASLVRKLLVTRR